MRNSIIFGCLSLIILVIAIIFYLTNSSSDEVTYRLAKVERGNILKSVSASGELNAVVTVEVGSEISGQISEILVDFNSNVKAGQIIARIDPESFNARVRQAQAELLVAKALVATKRAGVAQSAANLDNSISIKSAARADLSSIEVTVADLEEDFKRKQTLLKKGAVAKSAVDKARAAWRASAEKVSSAKSQLAAHRSTIEARKAQVAIAKAEVLHAKAQVDQKSAALNIAQVNQRNTFIRSPVDGVVIGRDIDVGQTVAASLQAPILFTIAQNLAKMQVETNIDEADIGQIRPGQTAKFSVDSFPGQEFIGLIRQIRKKPKTVQNVVTYTVVIAANNPNLKLLPGMTANVQVQVSNRKNVLKLPNRSLRFQPPGEILKQKTLAGGNQRLGRPNMEARRERAKARMKNLIETVRLTREQQEQVKKFNQGLRKRIRSLAQAGRDAGFRNAVNKLRQENSMKIMNILNSEQKIKYRNMLAERRANPAVPGKVWALENSNPKLINVMIGVGDGSFTELIRGDIKEGLDLIIGIKRP